MADAVTNNSQPRTPTPSRGSSQPPSAWSAGSFEAAMDQAAARRHAVEAGERQPKFLKRDDEVEPVRERSDDSRQDDKLSGEDGSDKAEGLTALAGQTQFAGLQAGQIGTVGFTGDAEAMAMMMEKAWLAAQADAAKGMQVQFTDKAFALAGFGVMRMADGGLSLQLASHQRSTPELERALELMRRRLEAKGVHLGDVSVAQADPDSLHRPVDQAR
jgi:hypothetical protein